jgi:LPS-assembly protein
VRQTLWYTDDFTDVKGDSDSFRTRQMVDMGAELSTKLMKIYSSDLGFADKIKHEILPQLEYAFIPGTTQDDLPYFDSLDRIEEHHLVTWSLTQNFISRTSGLTPKGEETFTYRDMAYVKIFQSYDIKKGADNDPRPFSDISMETELAVANYLFLNTDLTWSPYDNQFNSFNIGNTMEDNRGDRLKVGYRYARDLSESLYSHINICLTDELSTYGSIEKNLKDDKMVETQVGFTLTKSCWTVNLHFSESSGEHSIAFLISLHGIGELGTK